MVKLIKLIKANPALCLVIVLIALAGVIFFHMRSDRIQIKRRFDQLSELAGRSSGENMIVMAAQTEKLSNLFAAEAVLAVPVHNLEGTYSRREIVQSALRIKSQSESIRLDFYDLEIVQIIGEKALCRVTARVQATVDGEQINEVRELDCFLLKEDSRWVFSEFRISEILQR